MSRIYLEYSQLVYLIASWIYESLLRLESHLFFVLATSTSSRSASSRTRFFDPTHHPFMELFSLSSFGLRLVFLGLHLHLPKTLERLVYEIDLAIQSQNIRASVAQLPCCRPSAPVLDRAVELLAQCQTGDMEAAGKNPRSSDNPTERKFEVTQAEIAASTRNSQESLKSG
ncbi:hypothetical protein B0H10DRAFT_1972482 [Mycena sp. CBHHK59/15]|nr:hypothetical protein B0H10DRAFT_1972482 [Mycena sp. CBHHK59/15]